MGIPPCFPAIFVKGNNFCDLMLAFKNGARLKERKERVASKGAFAPIRVDSY